MSDFLQRVREAKANFTMKTGDWPTELFLGPREYMEFKELCMEYATHYTTTDGTERRDAPGELMGMTIIGLASDGLRAGNTSE